MHGKEIVSDFKHLVHDVMVTPYGKIIAVALGGHVKIINESDNSETYDFTIKSDCNAHVSLLKWSSTSFGSILAACSSDGEITILKEMKRKTWKLVHAYKGHKFAVASMVWAAPEFGLFLACGSYDGTISIHSETNDGCWESAAIDQAHSDGVMLVSWENSGKFEGLMLTSRGVDKTEKIWKLDFGIWKIASDAKHEVSRSQASDSDYRHRLRRLTLPYQSYKHSSFSSFPSSPSPGVSSRVYPPYPYTPTPSKLRASSFALLSSSHYSPNHSPSFLFILLICLRSLYSLVPFLQSSPPTFSLFPVSFIVSLCTFLLTLIFSLVSTRKSRFSMKTPIFSVFHMSLSEHKLLFAKSVFLAIVFLLRLQALMFCGAAAMILAEFSGSIAARSLSSIKELSSIQYRKQIHGFGILFSAFVMLSLSWEKSGCFPLSRGFAFAVITQHSCLRIQPMILSFLCGFLGSYERVHNISQLGQKRVRLISLFYATLLLFLPALFSITISSSKDNVLIGNLSWPLANTVVFGVLLSENYSERNMDFQREFLVTFFCTLSLELLYFPELSLPGIVLYGGLLYYSLRKLDPFSSGYFESYMEPLISSVMNPLRHVLSSKKSRKIIAFLLVNTTYMIVEFIAGYMSNSLGLISDACHMLFDCAALGIGLYASYISRLPSNTHFNYGRGRFEVLSGYINAVFLVLAGSLILLESFERILDPQEISTQSSLLVSIGGLLVNLVGLAFFHQEHHHHNHGEKKCSHNHHHVDHNMEGIFLHVMADTLGSVGVVVSTLLVKYKGWLVADPACSILISVLIVWSVLPLLKNSAEILLQRVPRAVEGEIFGVVESVGKIEGVQRITSFNVWSVTDDDVVATLSLEVSKDVKKGLLKGKVLDLMRLVGVKDVTVQLFDFMG